MSGSNESRYAVGDWVVYRKQKRGTHPAPRAKIVGAAEKGDSYAYLIDKYWIVVRVSPGKLTLRTRRGKLHEIEGDDPRLSKANLWQRWTLGYRYRSIDATPLAD
ncbi:MAG TPA: hypothetical protein DCQ98_08130 [Planctomycetaceae bacterium]|nr:hypothetical protein [Planctomycetaceae bacterium]HRF01647.1 hypothetical protein [Pirellulaceae bacterium]